MIAPTAMFILNKTMSDRVRNSSWTINVGKLAKWLRMLGYDAIFFHGSDDSEMVATEKI